MLWYRWIVVYDDHEWRHRRLVSRFWNFVCLSPLLWRYNGYYDVSNHQPHDCLLNRLFRRRSKKISKLRVTCLCAGNSPVTVNSPHKGPVTRQMFPFDDVIMIGKWLISHDYVILLTAFPKRFFHCIHIFHFEMGDTFIFHWHQQCRMPRR